MRTVMVVLVVLLAVIVPPLTSWAGEIARVTWCPQVVSGAIAVIVRDSSFGGFDWGSYSSEEALKTVMEYALEQTGRFTIADRSAREETWEEQDLAETGRMDMTTVPSKQKTVAARWFLYVTITTASVTEQTRVGLGSWTANADVQLLKAEIRGKIKLVPVETSTIAYMGKFGGTEIGYQVDGSVNIGRGWWSSAGIDGSWARQPAGRAVEQACRRAAEDLVNHFTAKAAAYVTTTGKVTLVTAENARIGINIASGKNLEVGDYVVFYEGNCEFAKYKVLVIRGQEVTVQTIREDRLPQQETFKVF